MEKGKKARVRITFPKKATLHFFLHFLSVILMGARVLPRIYSTILSKHQHPHHHIGRVILVRLLFNYRIVSWISRNNKKSYVSSISSYSPRMIVFHRKTKYNSYYTYVVVYFTSATGKRKRTKQKTSQECHRRHIVVKHKVKCRVKKWANIWYSLIWGGDASAFLFVRMAHRMRYEEIYRSKNKQTNS